MNQQDKKTDLTVALLQASIVWEAPQQNRTQYAALLEALAAEVDVAVLPEMFTTGFTMAPHAVAENMQGPTVAWLLEQAKKQHCAIVGSVAIKDGEHYYNRLLFVSPEGDLTTMTNDIRLPLQESEVYSQGTQEGILGAGAENMFAYLLRFAVPCLVTQRIRLRCTAVHRQLAASANTAWDTLLQARAIENMAYCIGVNRVGTDPNGHEYPGHSAVYDALGAALCGPLEEKATALCDVELGFASSVADAVAFLEIATNLSYVNHLVDVPVGTKLNGRWKIQDFFCLYFLIIRHPIVGYRWHPL